MEKSFGVRFVLLVVAAVCTAGEASAQLTIPRFTVASGGGNAAGGAFLVRGTIGQPAAGTLSGVVFVLHGGFWIGGGAVVAVGDDSPTGAPGTPSSTPLAFGVLAAAPNPMRSAMRIAFDLPAPDDVRIELHDVSGRRVRTLASGPFPAGRSVRTWDRLDDAGRRVAPGIYFLSLATGSHRNLQKIVVAF